MSISTRLVRVSAAFAAGALLFLAQAGTAAAAGTTRWVSPTGADSGNCTASACLTISYAVGQANPGDTVSVAAGTYYESVSVTKKLRLVGHDATIDASGLTATPNGVFISGATAAGTVVRGFTVVNANLEGIFVLQTSRIRIIDNVVMNNDAYGPFDPHCAPNLDDCGEAIHLQSVTSSTIKGNYVHDNVGGILLTDENGPTSGNAILNNRVMNNTFDCGITLASHWFDPSGAAAPGVAGVYKNLVQGNVSDGNGAAGIGVFAGGPGAAAWGNRIVRNTARDNGFAGVMIHSHFFSQNANDNVVVNNVLSANGTDDDNPADTGPTGISIFSDASMGAAPIQRTVVTANRISDEYFGLNTLNSAAPRGLRSNKFAGSVVDPISIN